MGTTAVATTTTAGTVELADKQCNFAKEVYLPNSPGLVPTVEVCTQLCEESSQCKSVTFFGNRWCSHFSTGCSNVEEEVGTAVVRLKPRSYTASWSITGGYGKQCDFRNGEVFLPGSSRIVGSLKECLLACEAAAGCRSVIFFYKTGYCSHVSTACEKTEQTADAISFTKPAITTTVATTTTTTSIATSTVTTVAITATTTTATTTTATTTAVATTTTAGTVELADKQCNFAKE